MGYTKQEIIQKLRKIEKLEEIYASEIINYKSLTVDTKEKCTEVIAKEILDNSEKYNFDSIDVIKRDRGYRQDSHKGEIKNKRSNRREELIAMKMYSNVYSDIGEMLDYQVPLKSSGKEKAENGNRRGKIDLLSYNNEKDTIYLIELKNDFSKESLLRCALEIITYSKMIDENRLKSDYDDCGININSKVRPAILIFKDTRPYDELQDEYVNKLIEKIDIDVFVSDVKEVFSIKKQ